jgi:hypothetical protein
LATRMQELQAQQSERNAIGHTHARASSPTIMGSNRILECELFTKNDHHALLEDGHGESRVGGRIQEGHPRVRNVHQKRSPCTNNELKLAVKPVGSWQAYATTPLLTTVLLQEQFTKSPPDTTGPSVFGRNLQCQLVRNVDTREERHRSHECSLQAEQRPGTNGILECKNLSKMNTVLSPG